MSQDFLVILTFFSEKLGAPLAHSNSMSRSNTFENNPIIIYFDIDESVRRQRMLERNMPGDSVERRIEADRKDFENFTNYDLKITNPDF